MARTITCKQCGSHFGTYSKYENHFQNSWKCEYGSSSRGDSSYRRN